MVFNYAPDERRPPAPCEHCGGHHQYTPPCNPDGSRPTTISAAWPADELAWARECFLSGDSFEEIAEAAGRTVTDVARQLGSGRSMTAKEREVLSLYVAGCTFPEIDRTRGVIGNKVGKAAAACITGLRRKGFQIPHRIPAIAAANSPSGQPS